MATSREVGTSETISTFGGTGQGRDYTSVSTWEAATDNDLVTATASEVLECFADDASYSITGITIAGATTDASFFRIVRAESGSRHGGIPGGGIKFSSTSTAHSFSSSENYFQLQDVENDKSVNDAATNIFCFNMAAFNKSIGLISKAVNSGSGTAGGIRMTGFNESKAAVNCISYECDGEGFHIRGKGTGAWDATYNCTAAGCGTGFNAFAASPILKNCLGENSTTDFAGTWGTSNNNASKDTTAPGTSNRISQTFTFVDDANDDWHLASGDGGAKDFGADLSGDGDFAFDDDVDFQTRVVSWDIGFDEFKGGDSFPGWRRKPMINLMGV